MTSALTANGLAIPALTDIVTALGIAQRAALDANLDTDPDAPMGQINGIFGERERLVWEALQVAYDGMNPDAAEDFLLDALCALTGTKRAAATFGTVKVNLNIDATTTIPAGTTFADSSDNTIQFTLDADVTSTTAGVYAGLGATCTRLGRIVCNAGLLTVIQSPVSGLNSVTNPADAIAGQEEDLDPGLRIRRVNELEGAGSSSVDSIRAAIDQLRADDGSAPVQDCVVVENFSDYPSADGQPAHSVEAIIWDGASHDASDDAVAQAIWDNRAGGITAFGSTPGNAVDNLGVTQVMHFTRANELDLEMAITVEIDQGNPASYGGDVALKAALAAQAVLSGVLGISEVRAMQFAKAAQATGLGVLDVTNLQIGNVLSTLLGNIVNFPVPARTKVLLDTSNIAVTVVLVSP